MKRFLKSIPYIFILYGIFFSPVLHAQSDKVRTPSEGKKHGAFLKIKSPKYNFGSVKQGTIVKIEYEFVNSGTDTLHISNIEVTCGCTVADFPHYPIKPGADGTILITFKTKEFSEKTNRSVQVVSNALNSPTKLYFNGVIEEVK